MRSESLIPVWIMHTLGDAMFIAMGVITVAFVAVFLWRMATD